MLKKILNKVKNILSNNFIMKGINKHNYKVEYRFEKENLIKKIGQMKYESNGNDYAFTEKIFKLPFKEFQIFKAEYKEMYKAMINEKKRRIRINLKGSF